MESFGAGVARTGELYPLEITHSSRHYAHTTQFWIRCGNLSIRRLLEENYAQCSLHNGGERFGWLDDVAAYHPVQIEFNILLSFGALSQHRY